MNTHTHTSVISATWTKCNRKKLQHTNSEEYRKRNRRRIQNENIATCKSATWNSAIHKKISTRKKVQHEKITTQKSATWKWCSMEKVQQEKSKKGTKCNMKKKNCHSEIQKKCTRIVHYSVQMDNGPSVDGSLYSGLRWSWSLTSKEFYIVAVHKTAFEWLAANKFWSNSKTFSRSSYILVFSFFIFSITCFFY